MEIVKIAGKPSTVVGKQNTNLVLRGQAIKIQYGNKFIDLIKDGKLCTGQSFTEDTTEQTLEEGFENIDDKIYLVSGEKKFNLSDLTDKRYVSYNNTQETTGVQKTQSLKNSGLCYDSVNEIPNDFVGISYVISENKLYSCNNGNIVEYISTVSNDLVINSLQCKNLNAESIRIGSNVKLYESSNNAVFDVKSLQIGSYFLLKDNILTTTNIQSEDYSDTQGYNLYKNDNDEYVLHIDRVEERDNSKYIQNLFESNCNSNFDNIITEQSSYNEVYTQLTLKYAHNYKVDDVIGIYSRSNNQLIITNLESGKSKLEIITSVMTADTSFTVEYNTGEAIDILTEDAKSDESVEEDLPEFDLPTIDQIPLQPWDPNIQTPIDPGTQDPGVQDPGIRSNYSVRSAKTCTIVVPANSNSGSIIINEPVVQAKIVNEPVVQYDSTVVKNKFTAYKVIEISNKSIVISKSFDSGLNLVNQKIFLISSSNKNCYIRNNGANIETIENGKITNKIGNVSEEAALQLMENQDSNLISGIYSSNFIGYDSKLYDTKFKTQSDSFPKYEDITIPTNVNSNTYNDVVPSMGWIKQMIDSLLPIGTIIMFNNSNNIPPGWAICNGQNGTPNLIDKFIKSSSSTGIGTDQISVTLGANNIPSHTHSIPALTTNSAGNHSHTHSDFRMLSAEAGSIPPADVPGTTSEDGEHSHTTNKSTTGATGNGASFNVPFSYYKLIFIMKIKNFNEI